jgi:hypothetical protein
MRKRVKRVLDKTTVDDKVAGGVRTVADKTTIDDRILQASKRFHQEVRKNIATAILAAFGFMIALVWRDVVKDGVTKLIEYSNLNGDGYTFTVITAFITTILCVIGIIYFSRWSEKK